jgi:hypothetical protein
MTRQYVVAVTLLGLAACATSVPEEANLEDEYARVEYESGRICSYERTTGSMMRKKVCRTQAEIDEAREHAKKVLKDMDETSIPTSPE